MDMTTTPVQHATDISRGIDHAADCLLIEQFELIVTVTLPQLLLLFQLVELPGVDCRKYTAILQVAVDAITLDPVTDDASAFEGHFAQQAGVLRAHLFFNDIQVTAVTVDDLPTVAPGRTETDLGRFQHSHPESVFQQK